MIIFNLKEAVNLSGINLYAFKPALSNQYSSTGWIEPFDGDDFIYQYDKFSVITFKKEEKTLPAGEVKRRVDEKVRIIEVDQLRKVYRKERDNIKDEVILDMLPRAFSKFKTFNIYFTTKQIFVDVDNATAAEEALSYLRSCLGSLPVTHFEVNKSPSNVMSTWILNDEWPAGLQDNDTFLKVANVEGAETTFKNQDYIDDDVIEVVNNLPLVKEIGLSWEDKYSFKLTDDLVIKSLKADESITEAKDAMEDNESIIRYDVWTICTEMTRISEVLTKAFN